MKYTVLNVVHIGCLTDGVFHLHSWIGTPSPNFRFDWMFLKLSSWLQTLIEWVSMVSVYSRCTWALKSVDHCSGRGVHDHSLLCSVFSCLFSLTHFCFMGWLLLIVDWARFRVLIRYFIFLDFFYFSSPDVHSSRSEVYSGVIGLAVCVLSFRMFSNSCKHGAFEECKCNSNHVLTHWSY